MTGSLRGGDRRGASGTGALPSGAKTSAEGTPRHEGAALQPERGAARRRFSTKGRLYVVFAVLAAGLALGFALQLRTLEEMGSALARIERIDEGKRVALELERQVRIRYVREARASRGGDAALPPAAPAERVAQLIALLDVHLPDAEARAGVERIRAAVHALDRAMAQEDVHLEGARQDHYRLLFEVEEAVDALMALVQRMDAAACASVEAVRTTTLGYALAFLVGLPALAIASALHLSRSIARPLRRIGAGAARIAAGDLDTRVDAGGPEEFDVLAAQVNAMAAQLKRDQEELVRAETLAGLGRMAAGIAHELNDPLQVILGYLSLHRDRVAGELGRDLGRMTREATRCRDIVSSLLQLARPAVRQPCVPVDLYEASLDVAGALRMTMNGRAPAITVVGAGTALGSPATIQQILLNLVKNAAEASGAAGAVEIRVSADERRARVSVSDRGPGVSAEHRKRIFDPFFTTKPQGTGLGLPIARSAAGALGGDLVLEPGDGPGATFTLFLPMEPSGGRP